MGNLDFSNLFVALNGQAYAVARRRPRDAGAPTINYGLFINFGDRLRHRRVRHLPPRQAGQPPQEGGARGRSDDEGVSVLPHSDPLARQTRCPSVHVRDQGGLRL